MYYISHVIAIFFPVLFALPGCDVLGDKNENKELEEACMVATLNGEHFETDECQAFELIDVIDDSGGVVLQGFFSDGFEEWIALDIPGVRQGDQDQYRVNGVEEQVGKVRATYRKDRGLTADNFFVTPPGRGTITIDEFTREVIAGSFQFEASTDDGASVDVTDGKFRIVLPR